MRLRVAALLLLAHAAQAKGWEHRSSCFAAVRWKGDTPIVRFESAWWEIVTLQGKTPKQIVEFARGKYQSKWRKRIVEDLGQVLDEMGVATPRNRQVSLVLKGVSDKQEKSVEAPMTYALRQHAKAAGHDLPFLTLKRKHGEGSAKFAHLASRPRPDHTDAGRMLGAADAMSDLDELEAYLEGSYSYLKRRKVDYRAALDTIRAGLGEKIDRVTFALQIRKFLALFGDGHADVEGSLSAMGGRQHAPFLFGAVKDRIVAFKGDRSGFLDEAHPYLAAIDDEPVAKWLDAARIPVPSGSKQFVDRMARRNLRFIAYLRQEMGLRRRPVIRVTLASEDGQSTVVQRLDLERGRKRYGDWPRGESRVLSGDIGYLRLPRMGGSPDFLAGIETRMGEFRRTRGLIIDVRGNGGGSRAPLRTLAAYFLTDKSPPRMANVAAYRLPKWEGKQSAEGHLDDRFLHPLTWSGWSDAQKTLIEAHAKGFKPEWRPPRKDFTKWHYMLLDRGAAGHAYVYEEQVVILMDSGCYSATDVFLGALKGWPGITLVGTPSGGGSGRRKEFGLAASGLRVTLPSMASFTPAGKLYDGNGIQPDVVVEPDLGYWVGRSDPQLDEALKRLR